MNKYPQEAKRKEVEQTPVSSREYTHPQRTKRRESAKRCVEARAKRTDEQQLKHLDKTLGKGKGATKERARLKIEIVKAKAPNKKNEKQPKQCGITE